MLSFVNPKCNINTSVCATMQDMEEYWEALTWLVPCFWFMCLGHSQEERATDLIIHAKYGLR
jgi:hypothetical protein